MADQRIQHTEELVGASHPVKADTINRLALVEHNSDGTHKSANVYADLIAKGPWTDVRAYGAKGDGVTDDSAAIQSAIDAWKAAPSGVLFFPPQKFRINTGLSMTFAVNDYGGRSISGYGAELVSNLSSGYMLTITSSAVVRHISINGLGFRGGAFEAGCLKLDGGSGALTQYLYGLKLDHVKCENYSGNGIHIVNNVFESVLLGVSSRTNNTAGYPIYVENGTYGAISSLDLVACNTSGGLIGVYVPSPANDVKVFGGTFILAQQYGMRLDNMIGGLVAGAHFENNWQGAANLAAGDAGLLVSGHGVISGVRGHTGDGYKQKYTVRVYTTGDVAVIGGYKTEDGASVGNTKYGYYQTSGSGAVSLVGTQAGSYDYVYPSNITEVAGGRFKSTIGGGRRIGIAYAASITPSLGLAEFYDISALTGNIVINTPTGAAAADGDEIGFSFKQDAAGGRTVTFSAAYVTTWTPDTAPNKYNFIRFKYKENKWRQIQASTGV